MIITKLDRDAKQKLSSLLQSIYQTWQMLQLLCVLRSPPHLLQPLLHSSRPLPLSIDRLSTTFPVFSRSWCFAGPSHAALPCLPVWCRAFYTCWLSPMPGLLCCLQVAFFAGPIHGHLHFLLTANTVLAWCLFLNPEVRRTPNSLLLPLYHSGLKPPSRLDLSSHDSLSALL